MNTEIKKRRTFAIISHPDSGKTTLTEQLLLSSGAIHLAGEVRSKRSRRHTRSDWMEIERRRGISITTSVMQFSWNEMIYNLLDTPGHQDFSEDTYRTLTAVDSAIMVLDAAKGIESQTLKLFEICRLRDIPVITFINKIDRDMKDPFALCDEIVDKLALDVAPLLWPIGTGPDLKGCYDIRKEMLYPFMKQHVNVSCSHDLGIVRDLMPAFNIKQYLLGHLTPVLFGSALKNFCVSVLLDLLKEISPSPLPKKTQTRIVSPEENSVTGCVFKVQANMNVHHRDRVAFVRLCSGKFVRGQKLFVPRTRKTFQVQNPMIFFSSERITLDYAYAGDIIGIPGYGLRVGDTVTTGEDLMFHGIAHFSPELFKRVVLKDPMQAKAFEIGLSHLGEEGVIQVFRMDMDNIRTVGVVGNLQLDVFQERLFKEYRVSIMLESSPYQLVRWITGDSKYLCSFIEDNRSSIAYDSDGYCVFLARNTWDLNYIRQQNPNIQFHDIKNI